MKIHEYQGKQILKKFGVTVPRGIHCTTVDDAVKAAETLGGKVWVVCGRPGDGKSVLMQNFCESAIEHGKSVRIYPLEMSQSEQAFRVLCSTGGIDNQSMGRGTLTRTEQEALALALKRMSAMKADIVDVDGATASDILHDIEQCDADVIMVDYLQLMEDTGPRKGATREEIIASVSRRLKRTAKKSNKIVLTARQLNDNGQLRESRAIGQDAGAVLVPVRGDRVLVLFVQDQIAD